MVGDYANKLRCVLKCILLLLATEVQISLVCIMVLYGSITNPYCELLIVRFSKYLKFVNESKQMSTRLCAYQKPCWEREASKHWNNFLPATK